MVVISMWQWQYWPSYDRFKKWQIKVGTKSNMQCEITQSRRQFDREWQWLGKSGTVRRSRSRRFEWWWLEGGSGSIGRVMIGLKNGK
jgi:hypothetical protein